MLEQSFFGDHFIDCQTKKEKKNVYLDDRELICLYFATSWSSPSRSFTEFLHKEFYNIVNKDSPLVEVLYIPVDDEDNFDLAIKDMPWIAYAPNSNKARSLIEQFDIVKVPVLIVLTPDGQLVTKKGRKDIMFLEDKAFDKWNSHGLNVARREKKLEEEEEDIDEFEADAKKRNSYKENSLVDSKY